MKGQEFLRISRPDLGLLEISYVGCPSFDPLVHGVQLVSNLFLKEKGQNSFIIDDGERLGGTLEFLLKEIEKLGFRAEIEERLSEYYERFRCEKTTIKELREKGLEILKISQIPGFSRNRRLLNHQKLGIAHAISVINAANFSVPGSGKTAVALGVFAFLLHRSEVSGIIVIGPASCFTPWEEEFTACFGRPPRVARLVGTPVARRVTLQTLVEIELILCTYQMALREIDNLTRVLSHSRWLLVLDESHYIKNFALGAWGRALLQLAPYATKRMILTGTPAPHSVRDLWTQFTFLWPSQAALGSHYEFERRLSEKQAVENVREYLKPLYIRTKKSDLGLPTPHTQFSLIQDSAIPKRQKLIIRLLELRTLREAQDYGLNESDVATLRSWRKARTIRLLQAASNPGLLSGTALDLGDPGPACDEEVSLRQLVAKYTENEVPAKVQFVVNSVRKLVKENKKIVVWASFVENLRLLSRMLSDLNPLLIYGAIRPYDDPDDPDEESRERNIREFKHNPNRLVLLANPAACAESISLHQECHNAVYLERTFHCGQFLQSMDRIHRVGLAKNVETTYYIPILQCAIETVLDARLKKRQETLYRLLEDDMPVMGLEEGTLLTEAEEEIDEIFADIVAEIGKRAKRPRSTARRRRTRR